jgi:hypothetical protein
MRRVRSGASIARQWSRAFIEVIFGVLVGSRLCEYASEVEPEMASCWDTLVTQCLDGQHS